MTRPALVVALTIAAPTVAQPSAADSALAERVLDGVRVEALMARSLDRLSRFSGSASRVTAGEFRRAARARLLSDLPRGQLEDAARLAGTPAYRRFWERVAATQQPGFDERVYEAFSNAPVVGFEEPSDADLAAEALAARGAEASGLVDLAARVARQTAFKVSRSLYGDGVDEKGRTAEEAADDVAASMRARLTPSTAFGLGVALRDVAPDSLEAVVASVESATGRAVTAAVMGGVGDVSVAGPRRPPRPPSDVPPRLARPSDRSSVLTVSATDPLAVGVGGAVIVRVAVGRSGTVDAAAVVRSDDARLDAAALAAVRRAVYLAGRRSGEPAPLPLDVTVQFALPPRP